MHIAEGVLSVEVLSAGAALTTVGVIYALRKMDYEKMPRVAVLTSAFFVAALIHIPVGPSSVHLVLNGLLGILSGWSVFPAILIGLLLQALFFQFGGITTLGVNTLNMALPGLIAYLLFKLIVKNHKRTTIVLGAGFTAFISITLSAFMVALSLALSGDSFLGVAKLLFLAHIPVMIIEGFISGLTVSFLLKVRPDVLGVSVIKESNEKEEAP